MNCRKGIARQGKSSPLAGKFLNLQDMLTCQFVAKIGEFFVNISSSMDVRNKPLCVSMRNEHPFDELSGTAFKLLHSAMQEQPEIGCILYTTKESEG